MAGEIISSSASGESAIADIALCRRVFTELERAYPGHAWMVGASHDAGTVTIDLPFEKPWRLRNYGMLLHLGGLFDAVSVKKIMRAGGELLERFGVERAAARPEGMERAAEHGLDIGGAVTRSRH